MFKQAKQGAISVISGSVPLSGDALDSLDSAFADCLREGQPHAVLDLRNTPLIDSAGLERLLELRDRFQKRTGVLKLAGANPLCQDILSVTGVGLQFEVFPEVSQAVGSFIQ
ncbi:MAG: STAS domain-containing protein [Planctomycetaceae bacterium]|nr:STAS domain-containing protein [Planctomycetales bacterium]MCB9923842.1 STAS domain-containing protein [Planctomycetaceae bacterium]